MDTIRYADGSIASIVRYVVGEWEHSAIDFGLSKRKATNWAKEQTQIGGPFSSLNVYALGGDGVAYGIWRACYGSLGRRIDP